MPEALSIGGGQISELTFTSAWGLSPGSGRFTLMGGNVSAGEEVSFVVGGATFLGIVRNSVANLDMGGVARSIEMVDYRWNLKQDQVFGFWNKVEVLEADPANPGAARKRKWSHLLPGNWNSWAITETDEPYTAKEIIEMMLGAPTVANSWTMASHGNLSVDPGLIDAETGKELGALIQEVLDGVGGLVLGLQGDRNLEAVVKGDGGAPQFPPTAKMKKLGEALTGAPTKLRIVGDRNVYQHSNIELVPAWAAGWEQWWAEPAWLDFVEATFGPFSAQRSGRAKLAARARTVTVREVVEAAGETYRDGRGWGESNRMDIPGWVYLQQIVWKAYEFPRSMTTNEVKLEHLKVNDRLISAMTYSSSDGIHRYATGTEEEVLYPDGKAFITVKGQPLDVYDPTRAAAFDPDMLSDARNKWSVNNQFKIDDHNKVIIFASATFIPGEDDKGLFVFPNHGVTGLPDELLHIAMPNPAVEVAASAVRATVCWQAERFTFATGSGKNSKAYYQASLRKETADQGRGELTYADGEKASTKAEELADIILSESATIVSGGYERPGVAGTVLTPAMNRVTVTVGIDVGIMETVEFADERIMGSWESSRELDRRARGQELFPGQRDLQREVKQLALISQQYKALEAKRPYYQNVADVMKRTSLSRDVSPRVLYFPEVTLHGDVKGGHVLFVDDEGKVDDEADAFGGVVIVSETSRINIEVATQGVVPVLVQGPFEQGDHVGCERPEPDGSHERVAVAQGERHIGRVEATYAGSEIILTPVRLGVPGNEVVRQLHIKRSVDEQVQIFFGNITGLGATGVPEGLTDGDWTDFPTEQRYAFKVEFVPKTGTELIYDGDGGSTSVWVVQSGGTDAEITVESYEYIPDDVNPNVDPVSGAVLENGVYYVEFGRALTVDGVLKIRNEFHGPVTVGFCAPQSFHFSYT